MWQTNLTKYWYKFNFITFLLIGSCFQRFSWSIFYLVRWFNWCFLLNFFSAKSFIQTICKRKLKNWSVLPQTMFVELLVFEPEWTSLTASCLSTQLICDKWSMRASNKWQGMSSFICSIYIAKIIEHILRKWKIQ